MNRLLIGAVDACKGGDHANYFGSLIILYFPIYLREITMTISYLFYSEPKIKLPRRVFLESLRPFFHILSKGRIWCTWSKIIFQM